MNKFSEKILGYWIAIPRWFRLFILSAITIYVILLALFEGVQIVFFNLESIELSTLIIALIGSLLIVIIFKVLSHNSK
ncbi:hypothetical protein [Jeotgalibacillus proteolyticus]|uniref:hypothetical protein n=1 Tax=Jeotgalibacillus proteolyticus TaxID=2082395 RepID=UPI003CF03714